MSYFLIIDGQQRLTTLMLLLCALRDRASADDEQAVARYDENYLINKFHEGEARLRLMPTEEDRQALLRWVNREPDNGAGDDLSRAYRFFAKRLTEGDQDGSALDLERLTRVVVERLEIVEITTQQGDNAHRIFQSLNGTGVRLNQADLLRNYLFMLLPSRAEPVYEEVWRPMEQLIGVSNLTGLARLDLQRRGWTVANDDVYARHQLRISPFSDDEGAVEEAIRDLSLRADYYKRLIDPASEPDSETREGLQRLGRWGAQTAHPVLMVALDLHARGVVDDVGLREVVALIESFFVRRQLARIPTNALNKVFVQLLDRLPEDDSFVAVLHREMSRDRLYWPSDDSIRQAVRAQPFFHIGRWHQRKLILERLERSFGHPEVIDFQEAQLQIEHIMPQSLSAAWREHLSGLGQDPDLVHYELVHTLGNLTLTAFNGTLSNNPFDRKQEIFGASHLEMNKALVEDEAWGQEQILARADVLAEKIISIWPAPIPGVTSTSEGFVWSRVDAAVAAIPPGRWTTYGALAELAGTGAQAVGNYIPAIAGESNAYRVLTSNGEPSESFQWWDEGDDRDVRDVLTAEGVNFDEAGRAVEADWLSPAALTALIDAPEQDADEDAAFASAVS